MAAVGAPVGAPPSCRSVTRWTSSTGPQVGAAAAMMASTTSRMDTRTPSAWREVVRLSAIPHGTMWSNMTRSVLTLSAKPCVVRPFDVRTPMAQIFRGATGPPGPLRWSPSSPTHTPG